MLKNGLVPSVFFRCPGLVFGRAVSEKLLSYGLISVGSDVWLAKGQQVRNGSIVLIPGNGNKLCFLLSPCVTGLQNNTGIF